MGQANPSFHKVSAVSTGQERHWCRGQVQKQRWMQVGRSVRRPRWDRGRPDRGSCPAGARGCEEGKQMLSGGQWLCPAPNEMGAGLGHGSWRRGCGVQGAGIQSSCSQFSHVYRCPCCFPWETLSLAELLPPTLAGTPAPRAGAVMQQGGDS